MNDITAQFTDLPVGFSRFANAQSTTAQFKEVTWSEIQQAIASPRESYIVVQSTDIADPAERLKLAKERLPLVYFGRFANDTRAAGSPGPMQISAVIGDYDAGEVAVSEAAQRLERFGMLAVIYSTPRHTHEKPRWRVIVPLVSPAPIEHRAALLRRVDTMLGNILGSESYDPKRCYFMGRVEGVKYEHASVKGKAQEPSVSDEEIAEAARYAPRERSAPVPAGEAADPRSDPLLLALAGAEMLGRYNGGAEWNVACPNADAHTDGRGAGRDDSTTLFARVHFDYGFKCQHAHCADVTLTDLIEACGAQDAINTARAQKAFRSSSDLLLSVQRVLEMGTGVALVRKVIYAGTFVMFAGQPKAGKSFAALDMALALVRGEDDWFGHETIGRRCRVLYINAEGSLSLRLRAYMQKNGLTPADLDGFVAITRRIKLDKKGGEALLAIVKEHEAIHGKFDLIVVDTVARAMVGNENSPEDMGVFVDACESLIGEHERAVAVVHHMGKDASRGSRGHSSLPAAVAGEIDIEYDESTGVRTLEVVFQRDHGELPPQGFRLEEVDLGIDPTSRRGEHLSSAIVAPCSMPRAQPGDPGGQSGEALKYLRALINAAREPVTLEVWRAECYRHALGGDKQDTRQKAFKRAMTVLKEAGRIDITDEMVRLQEITAVKEPDKE